MNFLITNSVALNGGDEALLLATYLGIKKKYPKSKISVLGKDSKLSSSIIDFVKIYPDWEYSIKTGNFLYRRRLSLQSRNIPLYSFFSRIIASKKERKIISLYRNADYILSSAGGYINDFYGYEKRLKSFEMGFYFGKKIILFGQSVGPFFDTKKNNHPLLINTLKRFHKIILRDKFSAEHIKKLDSTINNYSLTTDIAFTLKKHIPSYKKKKSKTNKKIAVAVRYWENDDVSSKLIQKSTTLVKHLIGSGYSITFLSTCQGIENYIDDSKMAIQIKSRLDNKYHEKIIIETKRYKPFDLIKKYNEFDAYIGMRLHGAILSMLGGTPAFNIGYEDKTKGIYEFLKLSEYNIDYDCPIEDWITKTSNFLTNLNKIEDSLEEKIEIACKAAEKNFETL